MKKEKIIQLFGQEIKLTSYNQGKSYKLSSQFLEIEKATMRQDLKNQFHMSAAIYRLLPSIVRIIEMKYENKQLTIKIDDSQLDTAIKDLFHLDSIDLQLTFLCTNPIFMDDISNPD